MAAKAVVSVLNKIFCFSAGDGNSEFICFSAEVAKAAAANGNRGGNLVNR